MEERLAQHYNWPQYWGMGIGETPIEIGYVEDFIFGTQSTTRKRVLILRYLVGNTGSWWPGRSVLVAPQWVEKIRWSERKVHVGLTQMSVKQAPAFAPPAFLNRRYEDVSSTLLGASDIGASCPAACDTRTSPNRGKTASRPAQLSSQTEKSNRNTTCSSWRSTLALANASHTHTHRPESFETVREVDVFLLAALETHRACSRL